MGVYYQTEYRLGRRGGVVCRTYTGPRAFLAIAFDLFFLLTFEFVLALVVLVMRNFWVIVRAFVTAMLYLLSVPFRVSRWVACKLERSDAEEHPHWERQQPFAKPAWTGGEEI
jgi:hypothetical protein